VIVIILGMVAPLIHFWRARRLREWSMTSAVLVLVAGFLLRVIIVFSSESV